MKSTLIVTLVACLSLLGVIGFVVYKELRTPTIKTTTTTPPQEKTIASPSPKETGEPVTLGVKNDKTSDSIPLGTNNTPAQTQPQPELLEPSQFSQYDEYKTSDKYLRNDIKVGTGAEVVSGKKIAVYYKGWLTDGQVFDQSQTNEKGELQPFIFTPGAREVIGGWEEGILGMKVGGIRRLVLPPVAAYGEAGQGSIPPNSVLIFDIQLLEVEQ